MCKFNQLAMLATLTMLLNKILVNCCSAMTVVELKDKNDNVKRQY